MRRRRVVPVGARRAKREVDYAAWVTIQIGCDNSCAFCIVPVGAGRGDQPAASATSWTRSSASPPTASSRSPCSARTSTPTAATSAPGSTGPQFADLLRAVDAVEGIHRVRYTSPAPEGPAPRDDRGHGRLPGGVRAPAPARCSRAATAPWPPCTAATPPSATSRSSRRPAPASPTSPSPPTSSSASPARPTTTSSARSRSSAAAEYDARLHVRLLAPRRAPRPPTLADRLRRRPDGRGASASSACGSWSSARALAKHRGARRARRGGPGRGPVEEGPVGAHRPHPPEQARALRLRPAAAARHLRHRRGHRRRPPLPAGRAGRGAGHPAATAPASPSPPGEHRPAAAVRPAPRARRPDRVGQVGARRSRWPARRGDVEIVSVDSMQVYRGMDIGTAKPTPAEQAEVPHHLIDVVDPDDDCSVARFQADCLRRAGRHRGAGQAGAARRRHRPVPAGGRRRPRDPRPVPRGAGRARRRARHRRRCFARLAGARPGRRRPHGAGQPASDRARPRGDPRQRSAVLVLRSRASTPTRRSPFPVVGLDIDRPAARRAHRAALRRPARRRLRGRGRGPAGPPGRPLPHRPPGARLRRAARPPRARHARSTRRSSTPCAAPAASPAASSAGSAATPASPGSRSTATSSSGPPGSSTTECVSRRLPPLTGVIEPSSARSTRSTSGIRSASWVITMVVRPARRSNTRSRTVRAGRPVEVGGRLVEHQDRGVGQQGPGDHHPLALAAAQVAAVLADPLGQAIGAGPDRLGDVGVGARLPDPVVVGVLVAEARGCRARSCRRGGRAGPRP